MSIVSHTQDNILKIVVENLDNKIDIKNLLELLESNQIIEISFFNIQILPKVIVIKLNEIKNRISIFTDEHILKTYLMNLNFKLHFKNQIINKNLNLDFIAIGGSAGSLKKIIKIIKNLPRSNLTIFIIMHQSADKQTNLAQILQTQTDYYRVIKATSDTKITPSTIYIAPPGKHLIVAGGFIFLTDDKKRNFAKPSISTSFEFLSNEYKNTLLAILVSGYGSDGSDVLELLQENGSTIIIQDPDECEAKPMVENAIKTKHYDYILTLEEICKFINENFDYENFNDEMLKEFLNKIHDKYGYDYREYNLAHIKRRVNLFYSTLNVNNFLEFEAIVLNNKNIFKDLFLNISVNITTFFRNPQVFKKLRKELLPKLDSYLDIKIWCAGCSSGEEPYSIAIILKELGLLDKSLIYATDLNEVILQQATNGLYSVENYNLFLKNYYQAGGEESFSSYFIKHDNFVEVENELQEKILFFRHNLVLDGKINDFQLIFCRNVLIYFNPELKNKIFELFRKSLDTYSFLILGESESLSNHQNFETIDNINRIYKRKK